MTGAKVMGGVTISVVMPAYNVSRYVVAALESLAGQTMPPDEVIIVDDGSTDDTLELIEKFHHPYPVKILSTNNQGQGRARNLGLSLATCEYVYFFDSDDMVTPDFVAGIKQLAEEAGHPDVIFFSGKSFYDGVEEGELKLEYGRGFDGSFKSTIDLLEAFRDSGRLSAATCLYMSKRHIWEDASLSFIDYYHEDECILYPLVMAAKSYLVTQKVFFLRRIREDSTMTQRKVPKHAQGMRATVTTLLEINRTISNRRISIFVNNRIRLFLKRYVSLCRKAGTEIDVSLLVRSCLALRDPSVLLYLFYYLFDGHARSRIMKCVGMEPKG